MCLPIKIYKTSCWNIRIALHLSLNGHFLKQYTTSQICIVKSLVVQLVSLLSVSNTLIPC